MNFIIIIKICKFGANITLLRLHRKGIRLSVISENIEFIINFDKRIKSDVIYLKLRKFLAVSYF